MTSDHMARDYLRRAQVRRRGLDTFLVAGLHGDVMRQAQEIVELVLKGGLRFVGVDPPKRHDVQGVMDQFVDRFPAEWALTIREQRSTIARLDAERGRAFYGDEVTDTPSSDLYGAEEAREALAVADRFLAMYERLLATEPETGR